MKPRTIIGIVLIVIIIATATYMFINKDNLFLTTVVHIDGCVDEYVYGQHTKSYDSYNNDTLIEGKCNVSMYNNARPNKWSDFLPNGN